MSQKAKHLREAEKALNTWLERLRLRRTINEWRIALAKRPDLVERLKIT